MPKTDCIGKCSAVVIGKAWKNENPLGLECFPMRYYLDQSNIMIYNFSCICYLLAQTQRKSMIYINVNKEKY